MQTRAGTEKPAQSLKTDSCGNVEPVQSCGDHVGRVASPRKYKDEVCGGPHDTRQLTEKILRSTAEESVATV